jgi:divalent metal cation (Fe/Co/Zn/Cd) transporter
VRDEVPLKKAHAISDEVERESKTFQDVETVTIHAGPARKEVIKAAIPVIEEKVSGR